MKDRYVVTDVYRKPMSGAISKTAATRYARQIHAETGNRVRVEKLRDGKLTNPARKRVSLKNSAHSAPQAFFKRRKARKKNAAMGYKGSAGWKASQAKPKSNPRKSVKVKNFTGTITRNKNGTVTVKGHGKVAGKK
jgi:hypothetical protein